MVSNLQQRKQHVLQFLFKHQNPVTYLLLAAIIIFTYLVRTSNLQQLLDVTTGKYIPLALDPFIFLRYAKELLATGTLSTFDMMRYFPDGYTQIGEFSLLTHFIVYLYKFLHFFSPSLTLEQVHVLYPPIAFCVTLFVFFFLVRKLFDGRIALLATAYLSVIPILLYRTISGFADKESFALMLFVFALYFYVTAWKHKQQTKSIVYGILAGISTGLMGLTWGGVQFMFVILGLFGLVEIIFGKFTNKDFTTYASWCITSFAIIPLFSGRYTLASLISPTFGIALFVLVMGFIDYLLRNRNVFKLQQKLHNKIPLGLFSLLVSLVFSFLFIVVVKGFSFITAIIKDQFNMLTNPFAESRWGVTVAESHQPYLIDIINQVGKLYFFVFLIASIFLFYQMVKHIKKHKFKLTVFYCAFILSFLFSKYSSDSVLNGKTSLAIFMYMGSLAIFFLGLFAFYFYTYKKDKETYQQILNMKKIYTLVFIWFFVKIIAARTAVRLVLLLSFITVILVAYLFVTLFDIARKQKNPFVKYALIIVLVVLVFNPGTTGTLANYADQTMGNAKYVSPSYNQQWQQAMTWVRENTPEDAVFATWWDYGYWIQTGGERATISDGGNVGGPGINYFTARHLLTAPNITDTLQFMKAKQANYFLTLSDDIGKYPAYSSIGSDLENDRYSWINLFHLDPSRTQESRNQTIFAYVGSTILDQDFTYEDHLFPERSAGIAAFVVGVINPETTDFAVVQPRALVIHNQQQYTIPLTCAVYNGKRYTYNTEGLDGCLLIVPHIEGGQLNTYGAAIYLSKKVKDSTFARLYLYGETLPHIEEVYNDKDQAPLASYGGRLFGPMKIWKITPPKDLVFDPILATKDLPDQRLYYAVP